MYLPNFKIMYLEIYKLFYLKKICMLLITLCSTTFVCKVFYFAHLILWHSHYCRMKWNIDSIFLSQCIQPWHSFCTCWADFYATDCQSIQTSVSMEFMPSHNHNHGCSLHWFFFPLLGPSRLYLATASTPISIFQILKAGEGFLYASAVRSLCSLSSMVTSPALLG